MARPRGLARRHRVARPRRLAGSHVVTGRHGRRRLAAGGIRRPAGTARIHAGLVTGTRRLGSSPAGRRPVLVPPAGRRSRRRCSWGSRSRRWRSRRRCSWGWRRSGGPQDFRDELASWRPRRATIPGHVEQAARCVHIRRVQHGRPTGARSAVTAACARGTSAEPVLAVPLRWARPRRACRARGKPPWVAGRRPPSDDPPYSQTAGTFQLHRSARWRKPPGPPDRTRRPRRPASSPSRTIFTGSWLVKSRMTTLAATKMTPNMTVTAAATARTMTRRTLLVVAVSERTAQRSHRGYPLASHMASCNHYDRHFGASPPGLRIRIGYAPSLTLLTWHFLFLRATWAQPPTVTDDTLGA